MLEKLTYRLLFLALLNFNLIATAQLEFVENKGQWNDVVHFKADLPGGTFFAEKDCFTFHFYDSELLALAHDAAPGTEFPDRLKKHAYKIHFINANTKHVTGLKSKKNYYNYYIGNDESKWVDHAKAFDKIHYESIYKNIDLKLYQKNGSLKYDFKVKPEGNPEDIELLIEGIDKPELIDGNLVLRNSINTITEYAPYTYQLINGILYEIESQFHLEGNKLTFEIGEYNKDYTLTIDPEITFSTYSGATSDNWGFTATNDEQGNLIGGSVVFGNGYPTTVGAYDVSFNQGTIDVAITKFNTDGSNLMFSTFIGGSLAEMPHSLIADSNDNIIIMGTTGSEDYPITAGAFQTSHAGGPYFDLPNVPNATHEDGSDFFVTKLSPSGNLSASTFVGGSDIDGLNNSNRLFYNYGDIYRGEVIVDANDNILVASVTKSTDFPTINSAQPSLAGGEFDGIGFKLSSNLSTLLWASYIGGTGDDAAYSVQVTSTGEMVFTGGTKSLNFPTTPGGTNTNFQGDVDGFIIKYNAIGNFMEASILLGTSDYDQCYFVQVDLDDNIYVIGQTEGNMPIVGNVYNNANSGQFIHKYTNDLSTLEWSTTIGTGSSNIDIALSAFLVSDCGQIYFTGWGGDTNVFNSPYAVFSTTNGMPITSDAYQSVTDGSDFYLCVLSNDAEDLNYGTYFGGGISNEHVDGGTSKFDKNGSVYQAVCAGCGNNDDFPYTPGAWSGNNASTNCNLGVFKFDLNVINAIVDIDGPTEICEGETIPFENFTTGADQYDWDFGDGNGSTEFDPEYQYDSFGNFEIMFIASSSQDCIDPDTVYLELTILQGVDPTADIPDLICPGGTAQLQGYGTDNLFWLFNPLLSDTNISNPTATVDEETTFYLVDSNECETDTVPVAVLFITSNTSISEEETICIGQSTNLQATGGNSYTWSPAESLDNPNIANPIATPNSTTLYIVTITTADLCEVEEEVSIEVIQDFPGGNIYEDLNMCINTSIELLALDGSNWLWTPAQTLNLDFIQNPVATPQVTTTYFVEVENICGTGTDQVTVYVITPNPEAGDGATMCLLEKVPVWATGGISYLWTPTSYFDEPQSATTLASPTQSGDITVYVTDEFGCTDEATVYIEVLPLPGVNAGGSSVIDIGETTELEGIAEGVDYWWTPNDPLSCSFCLNPSLTPIEDQWFTLHTIDEMGCENQDSVLVQLNFPIYVPNAFTPNSDGINDFFYAYGHNIKNYHLIIFNRWGEIIYESNDITNPWDGSYHNGEYYAPNGTYNWIITYDHKLVQKELRGHVTIIR